MDTTNRRRIVRACARCLALVAVAASTHAPFLFGAQRDNQSGKDSPKALESRRPKVTLRAQPSVGVAPLRVVLTGELQGGADDFEEYYCPTVEWAWGDDTNSESTIDCEPYEAGKSQIKRRFTIQRLFRLEGPHKVYLHLKRKDKIVGSASVTIQIQAGGNGSY